jgi:hypothetical protein
MQDLLHELEIIENEHKEFFAKNNLRAFQYVLIGKKPVMIRFNEKADAVCRLPDDAYKAINKLVYSYYNLRDDFFR